MPADDEDEELEVREVAKFVETSLISSPVTIIYTQATTKHMLEGTNPDSLAKVGRARIPAPTVVPPTRAIEENSSLCSDEDEDEDEDAENKAEDEDEDENEDDRNFLEDNDEVWKLGGCGDHPRLLPVAKRRTKKQSFMMELPEECLVLGGSSFFLRIIRNLLC